MKNLLRILFALSCVSLSFGQGVIVAPQTAFKVVNGLTSPIANATITVCAGNAAGIPCSPALASAIFKDAALTIPLSNPFFSDSVGNYQFAIAPGNYTITVTNSGFNGQSYQMTVATPISLASGLTDPGANGVVFRNGFGTTRPAVSADVIALFSGSCSVSTFIRGDGSCAAVGGVTSVFGRTGAVVAVANDYTFDQIGAGSNLNALSMGNLGSLQPVNFGRIINNATWMFPTDPFPSAAGPTWGGANTGGSLVSGSSYGVTVTLNSTAGETTPSGIAAFQLGTHVPACVTSACVITVTAPTLPIGFTGYTVYAQNITAVQSMQKIAGCTNVSTNCTFGSIPATSAPPTTNALVPIPPNALASRCPSNVSPIWWLPDSNGNMNAQAYLSFFTDNTGGPPSPSGIFTECGQHFFTDQKADPAVGKNAMIVIDHGAGTGTATGNQDRALWVLLNTPTNDSAGRYALEAIQAELDFNCNGCTSTGSPDAEITTISAQLSTAGASTRWTTTGYGTNAVQGRVFRSGAGFDTNGINAIYANAVNSSTTASAGDRLDAIRASFSSSANASNLNLIGLDLEGPSGSRNAGFIKGILSSASFTPTAGSDWFIDQRLHNWDSLLNDTIGIDGIKATDLAAVPMGGSFAVTGALSIAQMATPPGPNSPSCSGGASSYSYKFVYVDENGGRNPSTVGNTSSSCTNPLTSGNPVSIQAPTALNFWTGSILGGVSIEVWRTGGPMALGKIGTLTCNSDLPILGCNAFSDTGLAPSAGNFPTTNTTGGQQVAGYLGTTTNTVRVGSSGFTTAANTSLQTITGLTWNLDGNAKNYSFTCHLAYSQATANAAVAFGIQAVTNAPTNIFGKGSEQITVGPPATYVSGVLPTLATTTATAIVSGTPGATATNYVADLDGSIEEPVFTDGNIINIMVSTATSGDAVTVLRGSYCYLY